MSSNACGNHQLLQNIIQFFLTSASAVQWLARLNTNSPARARSRMKAVSAQLTQLFILPITSWSINGYLGKPREGKLWKLSCYSGPVSLGNGLISTTGSKANATGDERLQLHATIASAPTLHFTFLTSVCHGLRLKKINNFTKGW